METGTKYEARRDTAEVAKLVRADIKRAQAEGKLPSLLKVSVRISRFSGGSAVDVCVREAPVQIHSSEFVQHQLRTKGMQHFEGQWYSEAARSLLKTLEAIGEEYRRVDSDLQADYYSTNFYLHVKFDHELEHEDREMMTAYYAALPATHLRLVG